MTTTTITSNENSSTPSIEKQQFDEERINEKQNVEVKNDENESKLSDEDKVALSKIPKSWAKNIEQILFTEEQLQQRVKELAAAISKDYSKLLSSGESLLVVGLLKGAFLFVSDMIKHFTVPCVVDFMVVSSYGAHTESSGSIKLKKDIGFDPEGRHVLILEDLIDTGNTLQWIVKHFQEKKAKSVKLAVMLDKKARRTIDMEVDYRGYDCEDAFVVGYGMDYADHYRSLPFVGTLKPEVYQS